MKVSLAGVSFSYGRKVVLRDVTWRFNRGVTGLLGPNGAGKTTLLSLLVTLSRPKSGKIVVAGHDLGTTRDRAEARKLLGFVPQRFSLAAEMRVHDCVAYAGWMHGLPERDCDGAAESALEEVGLKELARRRVRGLSGGERQRLGLAAALAHDPAIVLLDEPTVGLDPGQRLRLRERIAAIGKDRTVVISSHLLEDIEHLCGRVAVIANGRLVFDGATNELDARIQHAESESSALGSRFERAYDALIADLDQNS